MQRVQRKFGTFLPRSANESQIGSLLNDLDDAEQMLTKIAENAKQWREAWHEILLHQVAIANEFEVLYKPIAATTETSSNHLPTITPREQLERTMQLKSILSELKVDMAHEINEMDSGMIQPALDAKESLKPIKKVIKRREDKKLDYERYKSRRDTLAGKTKLSDRDRNALSKHELDLERSTIEYEDADEHLRSHLPALVNALFALFPHLLAAQIEIQNRLLGNVYTVLHSYSEDWGFPSPPPEPEEVVPDWENTYTPLRKEIEAGFQILAGGKAIHAPMRHVESSTVTGLGIRNGMSNKRVPPSSTLVPRPQPQRAITVPAYDGTVAQRRSPSPQAPIPSPALDPTPAIDLSSKPRIGTANKPRMGSSPSPFQQAGAFTGSNALTTTTSNPIDYYSRLGANDGGGAAARPRVSSASSNSLLSSTAAAMTSHSARTSPIPSRNGSSLSLSQPASAAASAALAAGKKKPPPPPPPKPKRIGLLPPVEYVVAMYDFEAQGAGDLNFREGDRIRVVKKTESSQDWWEGELDGRRGSFPANYCR